MIGGRRPAQGPATLTAVSVPSMAKTLPLRTRIRLAMRYWTNWLQLARYAAVGVLGYAISVATFALCYHGLRTGSTLAATGAFCLALTNNFYWNRHWTFRAGDGHAGFQATRFVVINIAAFIFSLGVLRVLIDVASVAPVTAQAIAVLAAAPPNFVAHRIWSFRI
jgi:putative flippase GtrA